MTQKTYYKNLYEDKDSKNRRIETLMEAYERALIEYQTAALLHEEKLRHAHTPISSQNRCPRP